MGVSLGWLAVALVASAPAAAAREAGPQITYRFKTVEVKGLSWREAGLRPVAQHGSVSVWTAPDGFLAGVSPEAVAATEAAGPADEPVHVTTRKPREFVTRVVWKGKDGTPRPVVEHVREGLTATVVGRKLDQGVLARIVVEDVDVRAVHEVASRRPIEFGKANLRDAGAKFTVTVTASMDADASPQIDASGSGWQAGGRAVECKADAKAVKVGWAAGDPTRIPEVGRASAAGEWLIPDGEVLVVGFGPHTVADAEGKAVVRERLAVIAAEVADDADAPAALDPDVHEIPPPAPPVPVDVPRTAAALPRLPERVLPQPIHPDGTPAPAPIVPEDEAHAATVSDESAEPRPTPQTRHKPDAEPVADDAAAPAPADAPKAPEPKETAPAKPEPPKAEPSAIRSSFIPPALKGLPALDSLGGLISTNLLAGPFQSAQFLVPLKPLELKLPFNRKLEFELIGRVVADPEPAAPSVAGK
ncbi:hypothetical protein [Paludisphaera sp.]|uniref:hypothetical protein n=1 Tax=Paludisphaera sp. TaxID=2017432 RepID=UPI00301C34F1